MARIRVKPLPIDSIPDCSRVHERHFYVIGEIENPSPVKIGIASNARWRLRDLQCGNHRRLKLHCAWIVERPQAFALERGVKTALADKRVSGEWFDTEFEDVAHVISRLTEQVGEM